MFHFFVLKNQLLLLLNCSMGNIYWFSHLDLKVLLCPIQDHFVHGAIKIILTVLNYSVHHLVNLTEL